MHSTTESLHSNMSAVTYQRYHVQSSEYVQMTRMPKPSWRSSSAQVRPLEVRTMSATSRSCRRFPASSKAKLAKQQKALPAVFVHVTCCILVAVAVLPIATFVVRGCVDASRGTTGSSDAKPGFSLVIVRGCGWALRNFARCDREVVASLQAKSEALAKENQELKAVGEPSGDF